MPVLAVRLLVRLALGAALVLAVAACGGEDEHLPTDAAIDGPPGLDASLDAPGAQCGGFAGLVCGPTEYCDFALNNCGGTDETGICRPRPVGCPDVLVFLPTCACDGVVYGNPCDAYAAGADLNALGSCPVPGGAFACGYTQCNLFTQYCQRQVSDIADEPDEYSCRTAPDCPSQFPTCACLATEPCGNACTGAGATGLTLTCPGG